MRVLARIRWWMLLACAACASCTKTPPATATAVLRISQRNEPADLDPARATLPDEFFVIRALSEGLLTPNPDGGAPLPAAAERYDVSGDGLTYTFHLRAGAQWSNGEPVTASDFLAAYRRALTPATAAPKANVFFVVKNARDFLRGLIRDFDAVGFRAPDARTLVITLAQPNPRFPYYAASGPWIPVNPRVAEKFGRAWTRPDHFVGNGPFTLAEWRPQQRIVVKRSPMFHDAANVRLDEIQFIRFDDGDSEERAFRDHPAELHRVPLAETRFLTFNTQRPALADARVRRALALAIDRQKIVERVLLGGQEPATRLVPPALLVAGASRDDARGSGQATPLRDFNPGEARRLLAAAGFAGGKKFPALELSAWSRSQIPVLEAIQQMWKQELGLDVTLAVRDAKVHVAALISGGYDIGFITAIPDVADPADLLNRFADGAPENYPHWAGADFNRALAAADFDAAEQRLLDAAAIAPLYFNTHTWLQSPRVRGWREDALWTRFYTGVTVEPH
jgi:oligopeptide transport system substrate-binding protein